MRLFRYALPFAPHVLGHAFRRGLWMVRADGARADFAPWPPPQSDDALMARFHAVSFERAWAEANFRPPEDVAPVADATLLWPDREQRAQGSDAVDLDVGDAAAVKLKVRPGDEDLVRRLRSRVSAPLRLDGKRTLSMADARALAALAGDLEFFEEPTASLENNIALAREGIPVALDETVREVPPDDAISILASAPFGAVVLKATLLGPARTAAWVWAAAQTDTPVIVSSVFESGLGRAALHRLARSVAPHRVHGLGTHRFFATDLAPDAPLDSPLLVEVTPRASTFSAGTDAGATVGKAG